MNDSVKPVKQNVKPMKRRMTPEEKIQWNELKSFVEKEIFGYDENQKLQKGAMLRLRGLLRGQVVANNAQEVNGVYTCEVVLTTFKIQRRKILNAVQNKDFESEENKMAYVCAIVRNRLNDVSSRLQRAKEATEKVENIQLSIDKKKSQKGYRTRPMKNREKYEDLW